MYRTIMTSVIVIAKIATRERDICTTMATSKKDMKLMSEKKSKTKTRQQERTVRAIVSSICTSNHYQVEPLTQSMAKQLEC